jgi:hypothetical protein
MPLIKQKFYSNSTPTPTSYETGWQLPTVGENYTDGNPAWTNPNNITTITTATAATNDFLNTSNTRTLIAKTFPFSSIPDGATIDGVAVRVNMKASIPDSVDYSAKLVISGAPAGTSLSTSTLLSSSYTLRTYGNSTANWGNTLTDAIVKASNFGFSIVIDNPNDSDDNISIASVEMNVYYTV